MAVKCHSGQESALHDVVAACLDDEISEEEISLATEIIVYKDEEWAELVDAVLSREEDEIDYEDLEILLGEEGISDFIVCPHCGNIMEIEDERCSVCGKRVEVEPDPWSLYREVSRPGPDKELLMVYSDYESGKYLFLERIDSGLYVNLRLIEILIMEGMSSPVVRIYENVEMKGGD